MNKADLVLSLIHIFGHDGLHLLAYELQLHLGGEHGGRLHQAGDQTGHVQFLRGEDEAALGDGAVSYTQLDV